ncbi:GNAT family N-acetyltransferase, partial [Candidatus Sumerlaeota bacterium]|nr:GNAT family N-acetyltransferase [Candidatus Sumerlaeota bacterium]
RHYFTLAPPSGVALIGLAGLHHSPWSPPENVWPTRFAADPRRQAEGYGQRMLGEMLARAREMGFKKMMIETYEGDEFARARELYRRHGFIEAGSIASYQPDGTAMIAYLKHL